MRGDVTHERAPRFGLASVGDGDIAPTGIDPTGIALVVVGVALMGLGVWGLVKVLRS